jgi:hypothetical protein
MTALPAKVDVTGTYAPNTRSWANSESLRFRRGRRGGAQTWTRYDIRNKITKANAIARGQGPRCDAGLVQGEAMAVIKARVLCHRVKTAFLHARRFGAGNHADSESITANDTAIMKK